MSNRCTIGNRAGLNLCELIARLKYIITPLWKERGGRDILGGASNKSI